MSNKKKAYLTPPMIVRWAYLVTPSVKYKKDGSFGIKVAVEADSQEHQQLEDLLDKLKDATVPTATSDLKPAQRKRLAIVSPLKKEEDEETGEETGFYTMTLSMPAMVKRKTDGKVFRFAPDIFDAAGEPITGQERQALNIGSGSVVRVAFAADRGYCMEGEDMNGAKFYKAGVSVDLKAVKILDLIESGGSAASYGFDAEDEGSFSKKSISTPHVPNDFDDDTMEEPAGDGDF